MQSDASYHPSCPVDADTKQWIDARASWLVSQFSMERIRSCPVVLPTVEFFPGEFRGDEEDARALLDRICGFLALEPDQIDMHLYDDSARSRNEVLGVHGSDETLGLYVEDEGRFHILVEWNLLESPLDLSATMAHELCHIHLLGHGRVTEDDDDHELLTDLTTVFLGMGVITANSALHEQNWSSGNMEGWQISRRGYMTMQMYGYALALFSRTRDEYKPAWPKHLRPDVLHYFRKSLRYFDRHGLPELRSVKTTSARPNVERPRTLYEFEGRESEGKEQDQPLAFRNQRFGALFWTVVAAAVALVWILLNLTSS